MSLDVIRGVLTPVGSIIEKPARVNQIVRRTEALLAHADDHKTMVSFDDYESIIGVYLYMATTIVAMVSVLQYPLRNLHARFSPVLDSQYRRMIGKTIPLTRRARMAFELLITLAKSNPGVAFAPDTSAIDWSRAIWIVHDAAGDSGINDYRGHFTLIFLPGSPYTCYVKGRWTANQLVHHSTTLEACGGNCGLAALLSLVPTGDIVECYDSKSAVAALRRLGCHSVSLTEQVAWRGDLLRDSESAYRIFIFWFPRELNQMCDAGSKDEMAKLDALLLARALPPLALEPMLAPAVIRLTDVPTSSDFGPDARELH